MSPMAGGGGEDATRWTHMCWFDAVIPTCSRAASSVSPRPPLPFPPLPPPLPLPSPLPPPPFPFFCFIFCSAARFGFAFFLPLPPPCQRCERRAAEECGRRSVGGGVGRLRLCGRGDWTHLAATLAAALAAAFAAALATRLSAALATPAARGPPRSHLRVQIAGLLRTAVRVRPTALPHLAGG